MLRPLAVAAALLLVGLAGSAAAADAGAAHPFVIVGVDGMEWSVVEKLQAEGKMPNLAALRARGVSTKLATDYGAASPVVWTTVATGVDKDDHGITGFSVTTPTGTVPVSSTLRKVPAIWNMASGQGKRALVLGWWGSWPAEPIKGVVVTDRAVRPIADRVSPAEFEPLFANELKLAMADRAQFPKDEDAGAEDRMVAWFFERYAPRNFDLSIGYFHGIDLVSHKYWKFWEPGPFPASDPKDLAQHQDKVPGKYRAVDGAIGRIVKAAPADANVLVISDHGFGPLEEEYVKISMDLDAVLQAVGMLKRYGAGVDLAGSKVYTSDAAFFMMEKTVRFGAGIAEGDRPSVREELAKQLARVTYEKGGPVFSLRDAKPYERTRGDFVVQVGNGGVSKTLLLDGKPIAGAVKEIVEHSGGHAWLPPGVLVAAGPDIDPKADLTGIRIHDITPTVLYGMKLPVAEDFDGKVRTALYTEAFRAANPMRTIPSYGAKDGGKASASEVDTEMLEQLRSLGYIQ